MTQGWAEFLSGCQRLKYSLVQRTVQLLSFFGWTLNSHWIVPALCGLMICFLWAFGASQWAAKSSPGWDMAAIIGICCDELPLKWTWCGIHETSHKSSQITTKYQLQCLHFMHFLCLHLLNASDDVSSLWGLRHCLRSADEDVTNFDTTSRCFYDTFFMVQDHTSAIAYYCYSNRAPLFPRLPRWAPVLLDDRSSYLACETCETSSLIYIADLI